MPSKPGTVDSRRRRWQNELRYAYARAARLGVEVSIPSGPTALFCKPWPDHQLRRNRTDPSAPNYRPGGKKPQPPHGRQ